MVVVCFENFIWRRRSQFVFEFLVIVKLHVHQFMDIPRYCLWRKTALLLTMFITDALQFRHHCLTKRIMDLSVHVEEKQVFHKRCFKVLIACTFYELLTNTQSCVSMLTKRTFCILLFVIVDLFVCSPNDCFFCALWEKIFAEKWKSTLFSID